MPHAENRYRKQPNIVSREIAGEVILVPIRRNVGDLESVYTLNVTAGLAWRLMDGERTVGAIRDAIVAEYDVDVEQAEADLGELIEQLLSVQAISEL